MSGTRGLLCALALGAVLPLAGGCAIDNAFALAAFSQGKEHLFYGHLDGVTVATVVALKNMRVEAETTRDGDTVRVAGATKSGKKFTLFFTGVTGEGEPRTRIRVAWENGSDAAFWGEFLQGLAEAHLAMEARKAKGAS